MEYIKSQNMPLVFPDTVTSTHNAEVVDLTKIASTFPQIENPSIRRENIINTLAEMLNADTEVIIVDGPDGIGKTTLLAQFAREYPDHTFSIFIRSCSRYAYDSGMLMRDLCDQIGWVLKKENYRAEKEADPTQLLNTRIYDLQRLANYERSTYYFLIDGLEEIPQEDCNERDMILKLLPFGIPRFRFILSGPLASLNNRANKIHRISPFRLVGFTFEETCQFFNGFVLDSSTLETIHKICKMVPGNLASVRRLLKAGTTIEKLLDEFPDHPPDWFEVEWRVVEGGDYLLQKVLAILAFDKRYHSISSLSHLCKTDPAEIDKKLASCTFVERLSNGEMIVFVHDVFKRFAANRLFSLRRTVLDIVISDLLNTPDSEDALTHLPGFLHQADRYDDLLNYLSPEHIGNLIDCGESWAPLHQKAELGVDTAFSLNRDGDLLRFGLQRATIASIENSESWRSEIEAYVALDDFPAALALVQRMVTKEDRLQLLSVIARAKKIKKLPIEVELKDQIEQLYRMIDRRSLGNRGIEIASDLLYTNPELAVELVQECTDKGRGSEDSIDIALAKLSFRALLEKGEGGNGIESTQEALRAKVKDPKIQEFLNTISIFYGEYSAEEIIADVNKWEKAADRIYALRAWAVANAKRGDSATVVEYAMNTILKTTTYTANAKVYQELALPLMYISDLERVKSIIGRLDGLKDFIRSAGPTVEYVKLQCTLAEAEVRYDRYTASDRLLELFVYVDALTEPSTKLVAFAFLSQTLKRVDENKLFEANSGIHAAVLEGLKNIVNEILMKTADNYKAVRPAIAALARSDTRIALEVIGRLNILPQRETALVKFIEAIATEVPSTENFAALTEAYEKITILPIRAKATREAIHGLLSRKKELNSFVPNIITLHKWVMDIPDAEEKCQVICMLFEILFENKTAFNSLCSTLLKELSDVWEKIDEGWCKIGAGFKIVSMMAKFSPDISRNFLTKTTKARNEIILDCDEMAMSYIRCVHLTIRCFGGLIKRKLYTEEDFDDLQVMIEKIPSISVRAIAWSELALKFFVAHDTERGQKIVLERVRPFIDPDALENEDIRWQTITSVALALYNAHHSSAMQLLESLPMPFKDIAYGDICSFLIMNELPSESYDRASKPIFKINYLTFIDAIDVLQHIEADNVLYTYLESLVDNIQKHLRSDFSKVQISDILNKLHNLVDLKFPNPKYIKHDGYKILAEAQIARLEREKDAWDSLSSQARLIPNVADSSFVLMGIATALPAKESVKACALFREAKDLIEL
jgi:hypothetical protein